jgi:hypothetical protein
VTAARPSFVNVDSFGAEEAESLPPPPSSRLGLPTRSPFVSVYEAEGGDSGALPLREAYAALVDRLQDDEFEEALAAAHAEGRAFHDAQLAGGAAREVADRRLRQQFEPLMRESVAMVDAMAARFAPQEAAGIVDEEVQSFVEGYTPAEPLAPAFENLFGKLLKKVGGFVSTVAGKALHGLTALGLAPMLKLVRKHVLDILKSLASRVIGHLPPAVQPAARMLARKLGLPMQAEAADDNENEVPAQQLLDEQIAGAMLARDEGELECELAAGESTQAAPAAYAELEDARERFIGELESLKEGQSPQPALEQFLPAIMPALRIASKVIGRDRLASVVAGVASPLIGRLIGPEQAGPLSRAIADAGLKLLGMEVNEDDLQHLAAPAIAATVEETMVRVAGLPAEVFEDEMLLEAFTLEAFEGAAAANLPSLFPAETYERRPELLEGGVDAAWVMLPLARRPRRYKRCSRAFPVRLSPYMLREVETFEGAPLADFVQDQLGLADEGELEAEVLLYEALPGTSLTDIARGERETLGPSSSDEVNAEQLHPLTPQAAAVLLGRPGLGRAWWPGTRHRPLPGGQRFYALRWANAPRRHHHRRRHLHLRLTLDAVRDEVRGCVFLSEAKAQQLAVKLRQQSHAGALAAAFHRWIAPRLTHLFSGHARHRLRIVHASVAPGQSAAALVRRIAPASARAYSERLRGWLVQGFGEAIKSQAQQIIAATENAADGITLRFTVAQPPGLKALCAMAAGAAPAPAGDSAAGEPASVRVEIAPGHRCG